MIRQVVIVSALLFVAACSSTKPVLYPNDHFKQVGEEQAERDIEACREEAEAAGAHDGAEGEEVAGRTVKGAAVGATAGAVTGAIAGSAGRGAAVGAAIGATAGFIRGIFTPSHPGMALRNYVNRCLRDRGYDPVGWE